MISFSVGDNTQVCISKTQHNVYEGYKGSLYLTMCVSIGLDNPTNCYESRDSINRSHSKHEVGESLISTPICNSVVSLMCLGQHRLSPRHGRI